MITNAAIMRKTDTAMTHPTNDGVCQHASNASLHLLLTRKLGGCLSSRPVCCRVHVLIPLPSDSHDTGVREVNTHLDVAGVFYVPTPLP